MRAPRDPIWAADVTPLGPRWLNGRYASGCAVVFETYPSVDGRAFRVLLVSKFGPARYGPPPPSAYR